MEGFIFVIFVVVIIIIFVVVNTAKQRQELTGAYQRLASHYRGTCEPGGWLTRPSAHFTHGGSWVRINIYSTGGEDPTYYTQAHFQWPESHLRCEVYPEGMWSRVGKLMGMEDIEIGSPEFDRAYIIKGSDPATLRNLLTPPVQWQIDSLRRFLGNGDIYVSLSGGTLLVKKLSLMKRFDQLQHFVQLAIELYDQAVLTLEQGIEFVERTQPPKAAEVICQICGEPITSEVVFCRRCKTPHHRDCWEYYGACSTYGCRETRYLLPKPKRGRKLPKDASG